MGKILGRRQSARARTGRPLHARATSGRPVAPSAPQQAVFAVAEKGRARGCCRNPRVGQDAPRQRPHPCRETPRPVFRRSVSARPPGSKRGHPREAAHSVHALGLLGPCAPHRSHPRDCPVVLDPLPPPGSVAAPEGAAGTSRLARERTFTRHLHRPATGYPAA